MKGTRTKPILPPRILIEYDPAVADKVRAALAAADSGSFGVEWLRQLSKGLAGLSKGDDASLEKGARVDISMTAKQHK
jgi:hypothetical protein